MKNAEFLEDRGESYPAEDSVSRTQRTVASTRASLPTDRPRISPSLKLVTAEEYPLCHNLSTAIESVSRKYRVRFGVTLLAIFKSLVYRYWQENRTVLSVRFIESDSEGGESRSGQKYALQPFSVDFGDDPPFEVLLKRVNGAVQSFASGNEFPSKVEAKHQPLGFTFTDHPLPETSESPPKSAAAAGDQAEVDLHLKITRKEEGYWAQLDYVANQFEEDTIEHFYEHFETIGQSALDQMDSAVSNLRIIPADERRKLVVDWNATASEYPGETCLHQLVEEHASRAPDATAVRCGGQSITRIELEQRANGVAMRLKSEGITIDRPVGLFVDRSNDMLVAALGILKAGGCYVPLDPAFPQYRLEQILNDAQPAAVVTEAGLAKALPRGSWNPICVEGIEKAKSAPRTNEQTSQSLAYIIYTSGSTGTPKGVEISHRSVMNFLTSMRDRPGLNADDILLAVTSISFDISVLELFLPLVSEAQIVIATREEAIDGQRLSALLDEHGVTTMQATPATWRKMLDSGWNGKPKLRVLCGGETLPRDLADSLLSSSGTVWNLYGPTETTIWSTVEKVTPDNGTVSIGRPIANTTVYILDSNLQPVPIGLPGDLYIGGDGLARGYLNRPKLNREHFVQNPFHEGRIYNTGDIARYRTNGNIEFLGRRDSQVKVRGFRIELGEIEATLNRHSKINQSAVATYDTGGHRHLIAYLVAGQSAEPTGREMREFLADYLPDYMIPSAFIALEDLPLTPGGKIDRQALPKPQWSRRRSAMADHLEPPRNQIESTLAAIWESVLEVEEVGVTDSFFDLGGHSLLATRVLSRIRENLYVELSVRSVFESPTIRDLSKQIAEQRTEGGTRRRPPIETASETTHFPLSFGQRRLWFLHRMEPDSSVYNIHQTVRLDGALDIDALRKSINQLTATHESLRTTFTLVEDEPYQRIRPDLKIGMEIVEVEGASRDARLAEGNRLLERLSLTPFDLDQGPLFRTTLVKIGPRSYFLLLEMHHTISDGWSLTLSQ